MNAALQGASDDIVRPQAILVIRTHYRLPEKPQSTLEALRVFFPGDANRILEQLRANPIAVRRGDLRSIRVLAMSLRAQGFDVDVRALADDATEPTT